MDDIDTPEWADNPRLKRWLDSRRSAFPQWALEQGGRWDFSVASLGRLEELVKRRYPSYEAAESGSRSAFSSVAAWYLGEVLVHSHGLVWRCVPEEPPAPPVAGGRPLVYADRSTIPAAALELLDEDAEAGGEDDAIPWQPVIDPAATLQGVCAQEADWSLAYWAQACAEFRRWGETASR
ncbi:hypothetical protein A6A06_27550 [Streptomyces sp. CB02923]|uniref:hypothetical protein n=1 Tax=Streptomyces sp. CB02923 TaxID=1718985 RepID=UPI00093F2FA8|nr:hypothetical protein [Streptomyces sp. CB02923]OKH99298.1 hypothetical protein A6A06_27550 [Streptomyces sp. CB02923]